MVVVYYTLTHFLDAALEAIQSIKNSVTLHVIIEITPYSKKSTIIDIEDLNGLNVIESCEKVLGKEKWKHIKHYFDGVASVNFAVYKHKRSFSFAGLKTTGVLGEYIKRLNTEIIHFDTVSPRIVGIYPYIKSKKIFITVHDPKPHSGEYSWKKNISKFIFFRLAKGYFFYSDFACKQFKKYNTSLTTPMHVISFQPFTYISQFIQKRQSNSEAILFFGRLSKYKGVDLLLDAIPKVLEQYPNEKFIIAGSLSSNFKIGKKVINQHKNNIQIIEKYLNIEEVVQLIQNAKFLVCPYRDATQSGVLMTAFAAGKITIASNVGAFPEYITDNVNGLLSDPDAGILALKIIDALKHEKYKELEKNLFSSYSEKTGNKNQTCILNAYNT